MTNRYGSELSTAIRLAREAGKLVLHYRDPDIQVDMKVGDEPVTVADRESSDLVMSGLQAEFGDDVIISEERADDLRRLSADRVWYIDPIDGTRDFISGREGFAVMIGLTVGHVPMVGVVYQPIGERLFWAEPDGAWFEVPGQEPRRLAVSATADMAEIRLVASRSHRSHKIDRVKSALGISTEFNIGSVGLKLALIALAERDLYVNPSPRCKS
ncbi:MAG: 3'(2'),5'-bisphosphate nucleotidase CysQ, partial [Myxococcota bacterium]